MSAATVPPLPATASSQNRRRDRVSAVAPGHSRPSAVQGNPRPAATQVRGQSGARTAPRSRRQPATANASRSTSTATAPTSTQLPDASAAILGNHQLCMGAIQELETEVKRLNGEIVQLGQERDDLAREKDDLSQEKEQQAQASAHMHQQVQHHVLTFVQRTGASTRNLQLGLDQAIAGPAPVLPNAPLPTASQPHANTSDMTWQDPLGYENTDLTLPPTDIGLDFFQAMG